MTRKTICLLIAVCILSAAVAGCGRGEQKPVSSLTYTKVKYGGGGTVEYSFDFEKNVVVKSAYFYGDSENRQTDVIAEFTDDQKEELINELYSCGLFDIKREYKAPPGIQDGGGWELKVVFADGTTKESKGSNNSPQSVFNNCAKAFYDICGEGVVALVPKD